MDLLEFLVIAITAAAACLRQAWVSMQADCDSQTTVGRQAPDRQPQQAGALPKPANDTWSIPKAA